MSYLPKSRQELWHGKLADACAQPTYVDAKAALDALRAHLRRLNEFALRNLDEGLEETLTVHRLGVGPTLRQKLATTNMLEMLFSRVERRTRKVSRWRTSDQKQRWLVAAPLTGAKGGVTMRWVVFVENQLTPRTPPNNRRLCQSDRAGW